MEIMERVARAIAPEAWSLRDFMPERYNTDVFHRSDIDMSLVRAGAVLAAMKYEDGTDESVLIEVSNAKRIEAVSLSEAWDDMLDAHLRGA